MSVPLRKFFAVLISASILLGASGVGGAFAGALEHDLGIETQLGDSAPDTGSEGKSCSHGCGSHLAAHLVVLTETAPSIMAGAPGIEPSILPAAVPLRSRSDSFFRPPRSSLA